MCHHSSSLLVGRKGANDENHLQQQNDTWWVTEMGSSKMRQTNFKGKTGNFNNKRNKKKIIVIAKSCNDDRRGKSNMIWERTMIKKEAKGQRACEDAKKLSPNWKSELSMTNIFCFFHDDRFETRFLMRRFHLGRFPFRRFYFGRFHRSRSIDLSLVWIWVWIRYCKYRNWYGSSIRRTDTLTLSNLGNDGRKPD